MWEIMRQEFMQQVIDRSDWRVAASPKSNEDQLTPVAARPDQGWETRPIDGPKGELRDLSSYTIHTPGRLEGIGSPEEIG
ncbi:hypothetical protein PDE_02339 [Penicillium oxalicum 114-2]|uniref:Uncharacterized protein n=1 Tax=Penicillium oxalicum (strain 114-2 / CGMCC 5302) TaxID=933388 RepID=S7ZFI0_PENO1|nr:hypothetical protein PDE_02339 [Penicillium oxalicum 114-2]